ncbi:radial spoke head protein 3 homolog isoform X2 [Centruroides vittatus]|uniref:radial spoke head protein 3 homolog isoform X2 n=1 Tax=Centruroides vittatus TaxID=120091 RepID=UPI00350FAF0C
MMSTFLHKNYTESRSKPNRKLGIPKETFDSVSDNPRIRYDRHLLRGNTRTLTRISEFTPIVARKQKNLDYLYEFDVQTPPPVEGRLHIPIQTGVYLEELQKVVKERDVECQTDVFLERPATPFFVPAKIGVDVGTQIEEDELFDFDTEVIPVLDAFVGYILEQSLIEVIQEEELATLKERQRRFEELRACELTERQRLAEQDRRLQEEREYRILQNEEAAQIEEETTQKVAARAFARNYLIDLLPSLFHKLEEMGLFYDNIQQDIEETFWPWLMTKVDEEILSLSKTCKLLDSLIKEAVNGMSDHHPEEESRSTPDDIPTATTNLEMLEGSTLYSKKTAEEEAAHKMDKSEDDITK